MLMNTRPLLPREELMFKKLERDMDRYQKLYEKYQDPKYHSQYLAVSRLLGSIKFIYQNQEE